MKSLKKLKSFVFAACLGAAVVSVGCDNDTSKPQGGGQSKSPATQAGQDATAGKGSDEHGDAEHNRIPIGETTVGDLRLVATMDEPVKPGGEGAFDVVITGGKPKAVRFWVGTEDAKGSAKAKAEEETTNNWHTHAEVPDPLPPGSKFWVEVEPPTVETFTRSFDLKTE